MKPKLMIRWKPYRAVLWILAGLWRMRNTPMCASDLEYALTMPETT